MRRTRAESASRASPPRSSPSASRRLRKRAFCPAARLHITITQTHDQRSLPDASTYSQRLGYPLPGYLWLIVLPVVAFTRAK